MKQLDLEVEPTDACVKADRALTLFMINTLAENARKYTPKGGKVRIYARQENDFVEISVEDNGCGLSPEDVNHIIGEKVYDSKIIGMNDAPDREALRKNKGNGFGLMNCKGIIEKYKKTNPVFNVCLFNVKSTLGQGSRFYFRLPAGVRKVLTAILLVFSLGMVSCSKATDNDVPKETLTDSLTLALQAEYELLLNKASDYANEAYYCNVDGEYALALQYIDSAMVCLNEHYGKYAEEPHRYMTLVGDDIPAELDWWNEMFNSDFHVILDIRNEAAVAFLALKQWDEYGYNNAAYTTLYKLLGEDQSLEDFCRELERSTNNKTVSILLVIILLVTLCLGYYVLYFRRRLVNRWNLEQVLEINKQVFTASVISASEDEEMLKREEDVLKDIPQQIADNAFDAVNELLSIERLSIAVYNEAAHRLEYASNPLEGVAENKLVWEDLMQRCFDEQRYLSENGMQALPLIVKAGNSTQCIGVLCLVRSRMQQESDRLLLELIARYIAIVIFNAVVKLAMKYRDIETAQDEARRASWEDSLLHVQNMVLDNCLSTIKHETIYYPNRIKQLIGKLRSGKLSETEEQETVAAISELIEYYKGVFYILSQCASRQLEEVTFRRTVIPVPELLEAAEKYFRKVSRGVAASVVFSIETVSESVIGDVNQLHFLLENLIDEALSVPVAGKIRLTCAVEDDFVRFLFTDMRREKTREELNQLFYPNLVRMTAGEKGKLCGTEYLLCKQIIRDHDEFAGRRGCRINAEPAEKGGFAVYFTLPRYLKRIQPGR
jgi:signal transduction histidine kinase